MQISRQHIDANGSLTYQLSDPPDRTLHLQSLGTMILKIICSFPLWRKNALRITLPCIPVSISGRLSLLSPHAKSQEDGQNLSLYLLQLFKKSLTEILIEHLPKPDIECFSTFYQKNNYCWIFSYFFCHHVLRIDNNFKSLSSCINSCWSLSITRPNLSLWHVSSNTQTKKWCGLTV